MRHSKRPRRRIAAGIAVLGAVAGAMLGSATLAAAQPPPGPPPPPPPNCSAADLAGIMSGITAATSAYLFTHPDVNAFFTGLKGLPREEMRARVAEYGDINPQVRAELIGIRQPAVDFRNRCG